MLQNPIAENSVHVFVEFRLIFLNVGHCTFLPKQHKNLKCQYVIKKLCTLKCNGKLKVIITTYFDFNWVHRNQQKKGIDIAEKTI